MDHWAHTHSHTHAHSLSLSLSDTHTHTHRYSRQLMATKDMWNTETKEPSDQNLFQKTSVLLCLCCIMMLQHSVWCNVSRIMCGFFWEFCVFVSVFFWAWSVRVLVHLLVKQMHLFLVLKCACACASVGVCVCLCICWSKIKWSISSSTSWNNSCVQAP